MLLKLCPLFWVWTSALLVVSKVFLFLVYGFNSANVVATEFFTSMADMEVLLTTESILIRSCESFIKSHEIKLQSLRR